MSQRVYQKSRKQEVKCDNKKKKKKFKILKWQASNPTQPIKAKAEIDVSI